MLPIGDINPTRRPAVVTVIVIVACIVAYFGFQQRADDEVVDTRSGPVLVPADTSFTLRWAAVPCEVTQGSPLTLTEIARDSCERPSRSARLYPDKQVYLAIVVSLFMHGSLLHLGGNMLFLWIFGNNIEDRLGSLRFAGFYLIGGLAATVAHIAVQPSSTTPLIGASGAIAAVMGAYLVWFPNAPVRTLVLLFIPVYIRAKWFLGVWFVMQFFTDPASGVAWVAHVAGFVFGALVALLVRRRPKAAEHMFRGPYQPSGPWDSSGGFGPDGGGFGGRRWR
jgi:membrane associated rhomboid family serine protease